MEPSPEPACNGLCYVVMSSAKADVTSCALSAPGMCRCDVYPLLLFWIKNISLFFSV